MSKIIMLIPISSSVGLTSVSLGMVDILEEKGLSVGFMKPVFQPTSDLQNKIDRSTKIISNDKQIKIAPSIFIDEAEKNISNNEKDVLLEKIIANYKKIQDKTDIVVVEGLIPNKKNPYVGTLNYEIAKGLNAQIVLVAAHAGYNDPEKLKEHIETSALEYGGKLNKNILGVILNKFNAPSDFEERTRPDLTAIFDHTVNKIEKSKIKSAFDKGPLKLLSCIPWNADLIATRTIDVAKYIGATIINEGEIKTRRINNIVFCSRSLNNMVDYFKANTLLVTSADRPEVIIAASLATMNGIKFGGILLTGGYKIDPKIAKLCKSAFETGLPIFRVEGDTWQTALNLQNVSLEVPNDDKERIDAIRAYVNKYLDRKWVSDLIKSAPKSKQMSPPAFRYQLTELAKKANKKIVLPEGDEPRTIKAAVLCIERKISECILLADPKSVKRVAEAEGIKLPEGIKIINPEDIRENYVDRLVELRKSKGLTPEAAREQLEDNVVLGTMMLEMDEVDGLVSGAVHTTANTIRPPLQLIKTAPNTSLVSSVFFMLFPEEVFVFGDCAINPNPNAEQLSEIAIQSADSAKAFGVDPKVAMISYSTGTSGAGADVEKVREATELVKVKRPDIIIDGPLQYDAAVMEDVAKAKAPNSKVAGQATVFIFPDLNTGNTTYKAVQRSADLISIGPMLQGMRKPVNDLSRGALVDDIVYTIALTAIQAAQN